ncbi:MAG: hypothetical protein GF400_04175 [Candidatus Eisenbacteria bacterium]|nr:hypothetical protein [Candidatus Eisenbacteria bacterium]
MRLLVVPLLVLASFVPTARAQTIVFLGGGYGNEGYLVCRVGARRDLDAVFLRSGVGHLSTGLEAALLHWRNEDDALSGGVLSPNASYHFGSEAWAFRPFVRAGIGATYLSGTEMAGRYLSTRFQFEDRVGLGFVWRRLRAEVSYAHYSNGSIRQPNDGVEEVVLTIGWPLQGAGQ